MFEASTLSLRGGDDPLRPDPTDEALHKVLKEGVACQVLEEAMYLSDSAGMSAIVAEDNLNASVDMGTSEMEVLRYLADAVAAGPDRDRKDILRLCMDTYTLPKSGTSFQGHAAVQPCCWRWSMHRKRLILSGDVAINLIR